MTTEERAQKYARQPEVDFLHSSAVILNKPLAKRLYKSKATH